MNAHSLTREEAELLYAAYALDALDPDEEQALEAYLAGHDDARAEVDRLKTAAGWLGTIEHHRPAQSLRFRVLSAAFGARPPTPTSPPPSAHVSHAPRPDDWATHAGLYLEEGRRLDDLFGNLSSDDLDHPTVYGWQVRDVISHVLATDRLLAELLSDPTREVTVASLERATDTAIVTNRRRPIDDLRAEWREVAQRVAAFASHATVEELQRSYTWGGLPMALSTILVARSFENWTHGDDIRRSLRVNPLPVPDVEHIKIMSNIGIRSLPAALSVIGRPYPQITARITLTGEGGGDWMLPLAFGAETSTPTVQITADVLEYCYLTSARPTGRPVFTMTAIAGADVSTIDFDQLLADIVAASPAFTGV